MKLSNSKCNTLHLRQNNSTQQHRLGTKQLESSFTEKHQSVLVDGKLNTSHQHTLAAKKGSTHQAV